MSAVHECVDIIFGSLWVHDWIFNNYNFLQVQGYKGPAVVVVSCVTVDPPYRPHPHNLVGKEGCKKGVCTMTINGETMQCVFSNLGIQCVKKRDVEEALKLREEIRVDPFQSELLVGLVKK